MEDVMASGNIPTDIKLIDDNDYGGNHENNNPCINMHFYDCESVFRKLLG